MSREGLFFLLLILVVLFVIVLLLLFYIRLLKQQLKRLRNDLRQTRQIDNNQQMTISLMDSDLNNLTTEINSNLDYQKNLKLESERKETLMRQSISDIAHDLRTPLTVVKGNLQLLKQEELSQRARSYIGICIDKTNVLKGMVDDFFELSVLESEQILPNMKRMDLTNYVMQFLLNHETIIVEKDLTPNLHIPEKSLFVMADEMMLERMFSNLLNNILKYAKESFDIELVEESNHVKLTFSNGIEADNGIDVNHLFERTYRADKARQESGAGLGLYIVKLLATKQQIHVSAFMEENRLCFQMTFLQSDVERTCPHE